MILSRTIVDIFFFIRWINPNEKNEVDFNPQYSPVKHRVTSFAEWSKRAVILDAELEHRYRPDTFMCGERTATFRTLQAIVHENKRLHR